MSEQNKPAVRQQPSAAGEKRKHPPGILTYGSLQAMLFKGGVRIEKSLRELETRKKIPNSLYRRPTEIIYQWTAVENSFRMRLYTTLETEKMVTGAQRTGSARMRVSVRDAQSKQVVEFASGSYEFGRDARGWEPAVREILDRAFLFISRNRPICPLCRSTMEIRTGGRGQFWGCTSFPVCRGTRNIPEAFRRVAEITVNRAKSSDLSASGQPPAMSAVAATAAVSASSLTA